jgi:hypothetical protein
VTSISGKASILGYVEKARHKPPIHIPGSMTPITGVTELKQSNHTRKSMELSRRASRLKGKSV